MLRDLFSLLFHHNIFVHPSFLNLPRQEALHQKVKRKIKINKKDIGAPESRQTNRCERRTAKNRATHEEAKKKLAVVHRKTHKAKLNLNRTKVRVTKSLVKWTKMVIQ